MKKATESVPPDPLNRGNYLGWRAAPVVRLFDNGSKIWESLTMLFFFR